MKVYYNIITKKSAKEHAQEFTDKVRDVLGDSRGWAKFGYSFEEIEGKAPEGSETLEIILASDEEVEAYCGFKEREGISLSCYDPGAHKIMINLKNWLGGSKSTLPLERYRTYVINHEVGHALGLDHNVCPAPGQPGSVMQQMTKGPDHVAPCQENDLPRDDELDNAKWFHGKYPIAQGSYVGGGVDEAKQAVEDLGGQVIDDRVIFEDAQFSFRDLLKGMKHETEHDESLGSNMIRSAKIAIDHLRERRDYYNAMSFLEMIPKGFFGANFLAIVLALVVVIVILAFFFGSSLATKKEERLRTQ